MSNHGPEGRDDAATEHWPNRDDLRRFESKWRSGDRGAIERTVAETEPSLIPSVLSLLIPAEVRLRREAGDWPSPGEYLARFPANVALINAIFEGQSDTSPEVGRENGTTLDGRDQRKPPSSGPHSTEEFLVGDGHSSTVAEQAATELPGGEPVDDGKARSLKDECRYRIIDRHKIGGIGVIYRAEDLELNREVALKEIREQYANDPQSKARFLLEAEVIGNLEHPGIVPIHGKGHYRDGRVWYAMKFIEGESLQEAIKRFHEGRSSRSRSENELIFRGLLGRFVVACDAIEYAHSRDVLHRDIKPDNIMLGRFGETVVLDWGLAKILDGRADNESEVEGPLRLLASLEVDPTRFDKAIGTLRYMSPEQAIPKVGQIRRPSDVFSLGATLYCLLTGQAAYTGSDLNDVKERVIRGEFPQPRQVRPEVPAPLESICLKAMKIDPANRYSSARALAADIERWLAEEPVSVHKYPAMAIADRWARRHRTLVAATAALLITLSIALVVSNFLIRAEEKKAEENYRLAVTEKKRAEENAKLAQENFQIAYQAVDQMLARVSEQRLMYVPGMNEVRSEFGDDASRFLKRLVEKRPENRELRLMYAAKCTAAANNHWVAGRLERFFEYYDEIIATRVFLLAGDPSNLYHVNALAHDRMSKASVLQTSRRPTSSASAETNDSRGAKSMFEEGIVQLDELKAQGEAPVEVNYLRALLLNEQGRWLALREKKMAESEEAHVQADELMGRLRADFADVPDYRIEAAVALLQRGLARAAQGEKKQMEAETDFPSSGLVRRISPDSTGRHGKFSERARNPRFWIEDGPRIPLEYPARRGEMAGRVAFAV